MKITQTQTINIRKKTFASFIAITLPLVVTIIYAVGAFAYGPERKTFTIAQPADYITFNSITDNPNYGDERNFVLVKDAANTSAGGWTDEVTVEDGKEYLVRMYVHNNAGANLNLVAKNTRVSANVPTSYATSHQIDGFITADNANPARIWDSVILKGDKRFIAQFVGGSARYYNNINANPGFAMPDSIVTSAGAQVGYQSLNGDVPGCFEYSGIATFKIKVTTEKTGNFDVSKKVRLAGTSTWQDSVNAKVGDKLEYRLGFDNTGDTVQNNVILRDTPAKGIDYSEGSSTLKNATNPNGNGAAIGNDGLVASSGVNIGNYTPNSNAFVYYSATVTQDDLICGINRLRNTVSASTDNGRKTDTAEVIVNVECQPNECKPGIPKGDERCSEPCVPAEGETVDANGNCVPAALPTTGPAQIIAGILGVALISMGVAYWIKSRQSYKKALAGFTEDFTGEPKEELLTARTENHSHSFHEK